MTTSPSDPTDASATHLPNPGSAPTSEVSSAQVEPQAATPEPAATPTPTPKQRIKGPAPQGIPAHVLAAMGGVPLAPPPSAAQTAPRPAAGRVVRQDRGGLLASASPQTRQARKAVEQVRAQFAALVRASDAALAALAPLYRTLEAAPEVCVQEGFDLGAARQCADDLRAVLETHFPHGPKA